MSHSIQCVHCQAILKSAAPVPAGKKIRCPKCQQLFTTPVAPAAPPLDEDDETAAAIAKLEGDQALSKKPAPAPPPAPVVAPTPNEEEIPEIDDDLAVPDDEEEPRSRRKTDDSS